MTELIQDLSLAQAKSLIDSYAFDLGGKEPQELLNSWLETYSANWIGMATVEALYLGRYKAVSIEHILNVWLRIGTPNPHFTYEFERLICRKLPKHLSDLSELKSDRSTRRLKTPTSEIKAWGEPKRDEPQKTDRDSDRYNPPPTSSERAVTSPAQTISEKTSLDTTDVEVYSTPSSKNIPLISSLGLSSPTDWSEFTSGQKMIHHFIPVPDFSSFFNKLKTFGEEKLEN